MGNAPVEIGSYAVNQGTGASSYNIVTTAAVALHDAILVAFNIYSDSVSFSSVTDDASNTYTVISAVDGYNFTGGLAYCLNAAALSSGLNITINQTGGPTQYLTAVASKVVGGLTAIDGSGTGTHFGDTSYSVSTAATTNAIDLVVGVFTYYDTSALTFTHGVGYTQLDQQNVATSDSNGLLYEYLITSGTGTQTATATLNSAPNSGVNIIAAFKYPVTGVSASGAMTLTKLSVAATEREQAATAGMTLNNLSVAATATYALKTAAALTLNTPTMAATEREQAAAAALTLNNLTVAASATQAFSATAGLTLNNLTVAATAQQRVSAAAAMTLTLMTLAATEREQAGTAGLRLANLVVSGSVTYTAPIIITGATGTVTWGTAYSGTVTWGTAYSGTVTWGTY